MHVILTIWSRKMYSRSEHWGSNFNNISCPKRQYFKSVRSLNGVERMYLLIIIILLSSVTTADPPGEIPSLASLTLKLSTFYEYFETSHVKLIHSDPTHRLIVEGFAWELASCEYVSTIGKRKNRTSAKSSKWLNGYTVV